MAAALVHANVRAALRARLLTLPWIVAQGSPVTAVAWEGVAWPPVGQPAARAPYLRETFKPARSTVLALGPLVPIRQAGLWLVDVFVPADQQVALADQIAGELLDHFAPHRQLTYGGQVVMVRTVYRNPPLLDAQWHQAPVTVDWFADNVNVI